MNWNIDSGVSKAICQLESCEQIQLDNCAISSGAWKELKNLIGGHPKTLHMCQSTFRAKDFLYFALTYKGAMDVYVDDAGLEKIKPELKANRQLLGLPEFNIIFDHY